MLKIKSAKKERIIDLLLGATPIAVGLLLQWLYLSHIDKVYISYIVKYIYFLSILGILLGLSDLTSAIHTLRIFKKQKINIVNKTVTLTVNPIKTKIKRDLSLFTIFIFGLFPVYLRFTDSMAYWVNEEYRSFYFGAIIFLYFLIGMLVSKRLGKISE